MSLSFPASIFGVLDYPKVNGVIFPINYCIGCLNFVVNAVVMKVTGSLTGAYIVYLCLFLINILIVAKTEEGKWDKLKHTGINDKIICMNKSMTDLAMLYFYANLRKKSISSSLVFKNRVSSGLNPS